MKYITFQLSGLAAIAFFAMESAAAGFVTLPTSGSTSYVQCRTAGNFGSVGEITYPPSTDDVCVATNGVGVSLGLNSTPETGFNLVTSNSSSVTAFGETLATLNERVFRNNSTGECIYAKHLVMSSSSTHDYNPQVAGSQKILINDLAFGGFTGAVSAAYAKTSNVYASVYRIGRTFTSVQMQAAATDPTLIAPGYLVLPTVGGTVGTEINGVGQTLTPPGNPSTLQQQASFSSNWVNFTTNVTAGTNSKGISYPVSPNLYIKQACANSNTNVVANSMKLRQTGRETQPWVTVTSSARAPASTINP